MLIEDMGFTTRIKNALKHNGVHTIDDLISLSEYKIKGFANIGNLSANKIITKVKSLGFEFAPTWNDTFYYPSDLKILVNKIDELIYLVKKQNKETK
jgi:hypothetical protein